MGQHKALLIYKDKPLVEHLVARLKNDVQLLFVVGCPESGLYRELSVRVVMDDQKEIGPLGGVLTGLRYVREKNKSNQEPSQQSSFARIKANKKMMTKNIDIAYLLILPCDGIQLPRLFVSRLVRALERQKADLVYAKDANGEQHLYCLLKVELEDSLQQYIQQGGRKVIDWFHLQHYAVEDFSADHFVFSNLNTTDDWQEFLSASH